MQPPPLRTELSILQRPVSRARARLSVAFLIAIAVLALAAGAHAQANDGLKAGAYDAQRAADEAAAAVDAARRQADEAAERLKVAEQAAAGASAEATARSDAVRRAEAAVPAAGSVIEEVRNEAERANRKADEALALVKELEERFAYDRDGVYLGGGVFWAPQAWDTSGEFGVSDSRGLSGWIGYRFKPHFAMEVRVDRVDDFDFEGSDFLGQLNGWSITANAKFFLMTGRFQPYFDFGVGAFLSDIHHTHPQTDPSSFSDRDTNAVLRGSVGFDIYLSPSFALNLDAGFSHPTGNLSTS